MTLKSLDPRLRGDGGWGQAQRNPTWRRAVHAGGIAAFGRIGGCRP